MVSPISGATPKEQTYWKNTRGKDQKKDHAKIYKLAVLCLFFIVRFSDLKSIEQREWQMSKLGSNKKIRCENEIKYTSVCFIFKSNQNLNSDLFYREERGTKKQEDFTNEN